MKNIINTLFIFIIISSCTTEKKPDISKYPNIQKVIAQEVFHVKDYSYIKVTEGGQEKWLAAPLTDVEIGKTYYYEKSMEMKNFESKELQKTFESVFFVEKLSDNPENTSIHTTLKKEASEEIANQNSELVKPIEENKITLTKKEELTIEELLKNSEQYQNKTITIKGKVTKYSPNILGTNWIRIQDGTHFNGVADLAITSSIEVKIDEIITIKGIVALNKDLGSGYFYKVIVEKAEIIK